jgi:hypothetical protein
VKFDEEKSQLQQEKEQLLTEQLEVKEDGQQSTSLCDSLRNQGRRSSYTAGEPAHRSHPEAIATHNRFGATHCT